MGIIIAAVLMVAIIVGGSFFVKYKKSAYQLSVPELLKEMGNADRFISVAEAQKILSGKDTNYKFVDVRNSIDFGHRHLEGALNIPYHKLLQPTYLKKLKNETAQLILYGATLTQTNSAWMILKQKNIQGLKILQGVFESTANELLAVEEVDIPEIAAFFESISYGDVITAVDFMELYNSNEGLVIIDANKASAYNSSHIERAVNVNHSDLYREGDIPNLLLEPAELVAYFGQKGLSEKSQMVIYDDGTQKYSARVYHILKYLGAVDVRILHYNSNQWKKAGIPMSAEPVELPPTTFTPSVDTQLYASIDYVDEHKDNPAVKILDLRTSYEYSGFVNSKGHIPGAINLNHSELLTRSGAFKSKEELEAIAKELGITPDQELIFSCRTGIRASVGFVAFKNILEYEKVRVYDGSYIEWVSSGKDIQQ